MQRGELTRYLDQLLDSGHFKDYCPNGLQVEGCAEIERIVTGVTASQALVDAAIERKADAILVHHGWFWRGEDGRIAGFRRNRLKLLLAHDINLYGYHLPLDAHAQLGNNAQLAQRMEWSVDGRFGEQDIAWIGRMSEPTTRAELGRKLAVELGREPLVIGDDDEDRPLTRIAWCSGGAQSLFEEAVDQGVDVYLTGEVSEQNVHLARESGVTYIAAGHHATERYGVRALAEHLAERFGLQCEFVDIDSPV
jgi:dinuclear metal center YbgI/SA1388 family protein